MSRTALVAVLLVPAATGFQAASARVLAGGDSDCGLWWFVFRYPTSGGYWRPDQWFAS